MNPAEHAELIPPKFSSKQKLLHRIVMGTVLSLVAALFCRLDFQAGQSGRWLFPLWFVFVQMAIGELVPMLAAAGLAPHALIVHCGVAAMLLACGSEVYGDGLNWDDSAWASTAFGLAVIVAFLREVRGHTGERGHLFRLAGTVLALTYLGWPSVCMVWIRQWQNNGSGMVALLTVVAGVKLADVGAFTVGKMFGKTKLAPKLSPGKTWEGLLGALVGALGGVWLVVHVIGPRWLGVQLNVTWQAWLLYSLFLTLAGLFGDLAESMLKREAGWKDSSRWLPGLGGFLDILDSVLLGAPVAWACLQLGLLGA